MYEMAQNKFNILIFINFHEFLEQFCATIDIISDSFEWNISMKFGTLGTCSVIPKAISKLKAQNFKNYILIRYFVFSVHV